MNIYKLKINTMKKLILLLVAVLSIQGFMKAQGTDTLKIKTSAQCEMCKERIENALAYEKGIVNSNLDLKTKIVTVVYKPSKTNSDKIKMALSQVGYDADDVKADPKAYSKLPACCKKKE
jgi:copper chaperone CopZ